MQPLMLILGGLAAIGAAAALYQAVRAFRGAQADFAPSVQTFVLPAPIDGHQALTVRTASGRQVGLSFVPPQNGIAVLVSHGSPGTRVDVWRDVSALAAAGFGVAAFDWPGFGESDGPIRYGTPEREAFKAVVDFVTSQPQVRTVAAYGFSNGAALLSAFVPDEPRVKALLAVAPWSDAVEQTRFEFRSWGALTQWPAARVARHHIETGNLRPLDAVVRLGGRRCLFVAGTADTVVPPTASQALAAASGCELRMIDGAGHLDLREKVADWPGLLRSFFAGVQ